MTQDQQYNLSTLLQAIYDPNSPKYRHYISAEEFGSRFGPTAQEYQSVAGYVRSHHLKVTSSASDRILIDVHGTVANIEKAFGVNMGIYAGKNGPSQFFAANRNPTYPRNLGILYISGLTNYEQPHTALSTYRALGSNRPAANLSPGNAYVGYDFRAAYVPGTTLTGQGQSVALVEFDGYNPSDITAYENLSSPHLPNVSVEPILVDGFSGKPDNLPQGTNEFATEVTLDIDMAISMAPGLGKVYVYEGPNTAIAIANKFDQTGYDAASDDVLHRIAIDDSAKQVSCSWFGFGDRNTEIALEEMEAQGQSFFMASGDSGAFNKFDQFQNPPNPENQYGEMTVVGGTQLHTSHGPADMIWQSETAWNDANDGAGSGGICALEVPKYQIGLSHTTNKSSNSKRNIPDVSMVADNLFIVRNGGAWSGGGTSAAAPLWAGFMALVNEQSVSIEGYEPVGFANPALYRIAAGRDYSEDFHDISDYSTNDVSGQDTDEYRAVPGYDLATGLGTPMLNLINDLAPTPNPQPPSSASSGSH